jgi:hypothetical protein
VFLYLIYHIFKILPTSFPDGEPLLDADRVAIERLTDPAQIETLNDTFHSGVVWQLS